MKKILAMLLALVFISSSCGKEPAVEMADYNGNSDEYIYIYEDERNKGWEKDVICLAQTFLDKHPKLSSGEYKIITDLLTEEFYFSDELYDEELRAEFIEYINILIPKIDELDDNAIVSELRKAVALLDDAHSWASPISERYYPINFEAFYSEDGVDFYAVRLPIENEEAVYAKLKSVNGVSIEEIIALAKDYISCENEYGMYYQLETLLCTEEFMKNLGFVEENSDFSEFVFIKDDGSEISCNIYAATDSEFFKIEFTNTRLQDKDLLMYKNDLNFWYEFIDEETLYIKLSAFDTSDFSSLLKIVTELEKTVTAETPISKTIVDIRNNPGGSKIPGYNDFIEMLNKDEFGNVYALINDNCFSMSVVMTAILKQNVPDVILVGCPTAEYPNLFGVYNYSSEINSSGIYFQIGQYYVKSWPDYEYDALMPDITIYQTIEDYKNGVDTVLEAVLAME